MKVKSLAKITFDKDVAPTILSWCHEWGLYTCYKCRNRVNAKRLGGIVNVNGKPEIICNNIICLMNYAKMNLK